MIVGIGTDLCSISKLEGVLERTGQRFLDRCFTPGEQADCGDGLSQSKRLAVRFAAKEAFMKAVGLGWTNGMRWVDIAVAHDERGKPHLEVAGFAAQYAKKLGAHSIYVSLSHEGDMALAVVILESL